MKIKTLIICALLICTQTFSQTVGLPTERLALPPVQGDYLVCIYDWTAQDWYEPHQTYNHAGSYEFNVPSWGKWYWIGLWDLNSGQYVFGKWMGHFITD